MIIIRADGNSKIGLGHIMRCLSVADAFKRCGEDCLFVTAEDEYSGLIKSRGFGCEVLNTNPYELNGETEQFLNLLGGCDVKAVLIDSYYVSKEYLKSINNYYFTVYIDDIYAFAYPVNCLINYIICADKEKYTKLYGAEKSPHLLLGKDYIPLRSEFANLPSKVLPERIKNIFVSTGGADTQHIALNLIEAIYGGEFEEYIFNFVIGAANPDKAEIERKVKGNDNIIVYYNVPDINRLMLSCDAAISAAGSTLYELCACGLPIVTYTVADNQKDNEWAFVENKIAMSAGDARNNPTFAKSLLDLAKNTFSDNAKCAEMAENAKSFVDGGGADRIAKEILKIL